VPCKLLINDSFKKQTSQNYNLSFRTINLIVQLSTVYDAVLIVVSKMYTVRNSKFEQ
jgi:hypothetical protein